MALTELNFEFDNVKVSSDLKEWSHTGVVGSGDMEVMMETRDLGGRVQVKVVTPVRGFDEVWERVIARFAGEYPVGNLYIEINDNNATPFVAYMRLKQAMEEAKKGWEDE